MRADGSDARLVSPNANGFPSNNGGVFWSPDSRRLFYGSGDTVKGSGIWTVGVAGGPPRRITRGFDFSPSVSPDGRSIAFIRYTKGLVVRRNGRGRIVARNVWGRPVWSPNGKWIAFRGVDTLRVVRPTGGLVQVRSAVPRYCITACLPPGVVWSLDSRRLAYEVRNGIEIAARSGGAARLLVRGTTQELDWSPRGGAVAFVTTGGVGIASLRGQIGTLVGFGPGEALPGLAWSLARTDLPYRPPKEAPLVRVSARELEARVPIRQLSADGDRVAYWLCPHSLGIWRIGETQQVALGPATLAACRVPTVPQAPGSTVYDLALAGDRLAYLTVFGGNTTGWELRLTGLDRRDEGVKVDAGSQTTGNLDPPELGDVIGSGPALVYGSRSRFAPDPSRPEAIWRLDGATPVKVASAPSDLKPLALDEGRIVVRRADGSLELLDLVGARLRSFDVAALGAALAGDDLVVLVRGELRDYSASTGNLLSVWPLPDVPSSGRCRDYSCPGIRLTLDDAARGVVVYTLDGVVHLLRLRDGANVTVPGATAAEITDAGLFYAYPGEEPWPGRIRFMPFDELPLR
jgi:WD40-like Beta Propeller Repeat